MTDSCHATRTALDAGDEADGNLIDRAGAPSARDADRRSQTVYLVPTLPGDVRVSEGRRYGVGRPLVERPVENTELDGPLRAIRTGESRALVIVGDPGVGKTTLLDHLVAQASGCRVLRASGVQPEMGLAFSGPPSSIAGRPVRHTSTGVDLGELVKAADAARITPAGRVGLLLDGLATRFTDGCAAAPPVLQAGSVCPARADGPPEEELRWLHLAVATAAHLWDNRIWETLSAGHVQLAHRLGAGGTLVHALNMAIAVQVRLGELAAASALSEERAALTEATGSPVPAYSEPLLAAWRGREADAEQVFKSIGDEVARRREAQGVIIVEWSWAVLYNGLGRYEDALAAVLPASEHPPLIGLMPWAVRVELIEAAVRAGARRRCLRAAHRAH